MIQFDINKLLIAQAIHVRKSSNPIAKSLKQKINSIKVNTFNTLHSTKSTNPTSFSIKKKKKINEQHTYSIKSKHINKHQILKKQQNNKNKSKRPGSVVIRIVTNNNGIVPRTPSENPTISNMVFDVTHHSSFGNGSQGQHVPNDKGGLLPAVDELAGVHALGGDEELVLLLVSEGVAEADSGKRGTATRVVDDLSDDALEVAVALAEVEAAEPGGALTVVGVGLEDGPSTLTLSSDYTTH